LSEEKVRDDLIADGRLFHIRTTLLKYYEKFLKKDVLHKLGRRVLAELIKGSLMMRWLNNIVKICSRFVASCAFLMSYECSYLLVHIRRGKLHLKLQKKLQG
jgi:hypothetical protein